MKVIKRSFILLEVMIAIALLALVIIPLSSFPYKTYQKQIDLLKLVETQRLYGLAHAEFLEKIDTFYSQDEAALTPLTLDLGILGQTEYTPKASITREINEEKYQLLKVKIDLVSSNKSTFKPPFHQFTLYIEKN